MSEKLKVRYKASSTSTETATCDFVEEGEHGLILKENPGPEQIGYIPYDRLKYVEKNDS